jgi:hypothetical protein
MSNHISPRTLRRAAEHAARKAAARQAKLQSTKQAPAIAAEPETTSATAAAAETVTTAPSAPNVNFKEETMTEPKPASPISEARLAANRENAQKSSGPRTDAGKARSCLNAMKTGLTGTTMLFANIDELQRYHLHVSAYVTQFQPVGPEESALVQSIADLRWKLNRIPGLENAIIARDTLNLIEENPEMANGDIMLEIEVRRRNEKELRNLHLQENRLSRRRERETKELLRLQTERKAREAEALLEAAKAALLARHRNQPLTDIPGLGFDFSNKRYEAFMSSLTHTQRAKFLQEALADTAQQPQTMQTAA